MSRICLVRHGETDWNAAGKLQGRTDIPLNATGKQQARECGQYFARSHWDRIVTSPMKRAKQTAEIINMSLQLPIIEMAEFVERSFGDAEGMTKEERLASFPDGDIPNQEDRTSFNRRVIEGIQRVHEEYPNQKIILVAHGAVINAILTNFSNGKIGSGKSKLFNACISNLHLRENQWEIQDYNQVMHLSQYNNTNKERKGTK
ncbi:histidine phosphatase family protein [Lederbergia sp. NSJ-179]|uniref:histidine phosphatase family protein n=1 Tax=Lederbergia sp. NSJ-179 TaxID=2931402 RepID=UPI001FD07F6C|nr:histidine phosphatase family protein [Lederbergia sp. NSJ-179]MCJ7842419.1 histidine phosphatase family protein [Lederbergia sp. NSJ-179]